jgi:hypothetical protein
MQQGAGSLLIEGWLSLLGVPYNPNTPFASSLAMLPFPWKGLDGGWEWHVPSLYRADGRNRRFLKLIKMIEDMLKFIRRFNILGI